MILTIEEVLSTLIEKKKKKENTNETKLLFSDNINFFSFVSKVKIRRSFVCVDRKRKT